MSEKFKTPIINFVRSNPNAAALTSKLVQDKHNNRLGNDIGFNNNTILNQGSMELISKDIGESANDFENIISLFPDMELSIQILISSILSPKDMMGEEIIYRVNDNFLTPKITSGLLDIVKSHIDNHYKLKDNLYEIIKEILFISGSYAQAIIPESELDAVINSSTNISSESLINAKLINTEYEFVNLGFLGASKKETAGKETILEKAFESLNRTHDFTFSSKRVAEKVPDLEIMVSDNPDLLKLHLVHKKKIEQNSDSVIKSRFGIKSAEGITDYNELNKIKNALYKNNYTKVENIQTIGTDSKLTRRSIGRPLLLKLPSESILPVHTPGNPNDHVGYFILLDSSGNPVSISNDPSMYTNMDVDLNNQGNGMTSFLTNKVKNSIEGKNVKGANIQDYTKIYADIVETELLQRLKSGIYGDDVEVANVNDIYRIMLARSLKNKMTRLLYMPKKMISYITYNTHKNGVGKTLTDNIKILTSLRAMMLFSRLMASVKNSIGITEVKLKLDERDPDPTKSIEVAMHEIVKTRQQNFPLGISTPMDLVDWVQRAGFQFTFSGHPKIPDMEMEFEQRGSSNIMPDNDLDEDLRKRTIMAMGLSPETVDAGFGAEFATTVVQNNLLLSRRVQQIQTSITKQLKDLAVKLCNYDGVINAELTKFLKENVAEIKNNFKEEKIEVDDKILIDYVLEEFLVNLELELPKPNGISIDNQSDSFGKYSDFLDKAIEAWISSEIFNEDMAGELSSKMDGVKSSIKSYFLRKWLADNNILPELNDISLMELEGNFAKDIFSEQKDYLMTIIKKAVDFVKQMDDMHVAVDADLQEAGITESEGSYSSSSSDSPSGDDTSDDGGFDDMFSGGDGDDTEDGTDDNTTDEGGGDETSKSKPDGGFDENFG